MGKDALLRFSTWILVLLNSMETEGLVYAMPTLLVDIPFDIFRALKRTNQELSLTNDGCLAKKTF